MNIELLAPAGSFEALVAAVESGADAVYLGGTKYNARASADNFDEDMLKKAVKFAHIRGVKIYITLNILISDDELDDALEYVELLYNNDIDGIIVQDIGLLHLIKRFFPDMPVHCSTQMTIHNKDGVSLLKKIGAYRFVLAREMSIKEVTELIKATDAEVEIFVHGALCVCYSGQCLMSSLIGGRSGNRGKCAQPCRKAYTLVELDNKAPVDSNKKAYLLSTKDLNTIERLDEIVNSGVKSLKIEGRMKKPEYVSIVVKHYRDALQMLKDGGSLEIDQEARIELESAFNRDFTQGFLFNEKKHHIVNTVKPSNRGTFVGKVLWQKGNKAGISIERGSLNKGDGIEIIMGNGISIGMVISSSVKDRNGALVINTDKKLNLGSPVYKTYDKVLYEKANKEYFYHNKRKVPLSAEMHIGIDDGLWLKVWDSEGHYVEQKSKHNVEKAERVSITKDKVAAQMEKTGDTPYIFQSIEVHMDDSIYVPMSALNEIRRESLSAMDEVRAVRHNRQISKLNKKEFHYIAKRQYAEDDDNMLLGASIWKFDDIKPALDAGIDYIYYGTSERITEAVELCRKNKAEIFYTLPNIIKDSEKERYARIIRENNFDGIVISNISQLSLRDIKPDIRITGNYYLNIFNKASFDICLDLGADIICPSIELTLKQIKHLSKYYSKSMELIVYGQLPLMTMEYCPLYTASGCKGCIRQRSCGLRDERGAVFPIFCNDRKTQLLNSQVLFMAEDMEKVYDAGIRRFRLDFYREGKEDIKEIIEMYRHYNDRDKHVELIERIKKNGYTKGHYFRGVD